MIVHIEDTKDDVDIVLYSIRKGDGIEVLRRMRAEPRTAHIPVVVLSSSRDAGDVRSAFQAGANGYVCKSVDPVRSVELMRALVSYWLHANESAS